MSTENYEYRVGGSLAVDDPTYIQRNADNELYQSLLRGEFCHVLTARQMGKSSLRLRIRHRIESTGQGRCAAIDMTRIGSQQLSPEQWYQGLAFELQRRFDWPDPVDLPTWWRGLGQLSPVQKFGQWIETILLAAMPHQRLFIFLDEIDTVKGLSFPVGDFFALVRFCYNQRADNPAYQRLTWALFGVTTPRDLVADALQTPFNIDRSIHLQGFSGPEARPLAAGLVGIAHQPEQLLADLLGWTGGQPFLTQKLCQLLRQEPWPEPIAAGAEAAAVAAVVRSRLIENWEAEDDPEHLRTVRDRILANPRRTSRLLSLYRTILIQGRVKTDGSTDQAELQLAGLVVKDQGWLRVANPIYAAVFNGDWVTQLLSRQRPYAAAMQAWLASGQQDESRLLMGKALQEALEWASDKSLSDLDYRFLSASQGWAGKMVRMELDAQAKANLMLTAAQEKANQMIWLGYLSLGACLVISLTALLVGLLR